MRKRKSYVAYKRMEYRHTDMSSFRIQGEPNDTNDDCAGAAEGFSFRRLSVSSDKAISQPAEPYGRGRWRRLP